MDSNKCNITVQPARLLAAERIMQWQTHLLALHAARTVQPTYSVAWPLDAWGASSGIERSKVYVRPHGLRTESLPRERADAASLGGMDSSSSRAVEGEAVDGMGQAVSLALRCQGRSSRSAEYRAQEVSDSSNSRLSACSRSTLDGLAGRPAKSWLTSSGLERC